MSSEQAETVLMHGRYRVLEIEMLELS